LGEYVSSIVTYYRLIVLSVPLFVVYTVADIVKWNAIVWVPWVEIRYQARNSKRHYEKVKKVNPCMRSLGGRAVLLRIGKSLILVTLVVTMLLVMLSTSVTPLGPTRLFGETIRTGQETVLYVILGSSLIIALSLLVFVAARQGGAVRTDNREVSSSNSLAAPLGVLEPYKKSEDRGDEFSLAGSTLRMYWSLLSRRNTPIGLRTMQRELGFSSPSSAVYQLEKLMKLGLVSKDEMGDYVVRRVVKVGFLRDFLFLGKYALPKNVVYGVLTLLINITCFALLVLMQVQILVVCLAVMPGLVSASLFWQDAAKTLEYRDKLIGRRNNVR